MPPHDPGSSGTVKPGTLEKIGGGILVAVGLAGLLMPVLPGWLLIFAGLALMGEHRLHLWAKRQYGKFAARRKASKDRP